MRYESLSPKQMDEVYEYLYPGSKWKVRDGVLFNGKDRSGAIVVIQDFEMETGSAQWSYESGEEGELSGGCAFKDLYQFHEPVFAAKSIQE